MDAAKDMATSYTSRYYDCVTTGSTSARKSDDCDADIHLMQVTLPSALLLALH